MSEKVSLGRMVVDIETNNLLQNMLDFRTLPYKLKDSARLWCIVVRDLDTDEFWTLSSESGDTITKEDLQSVLKNTKEIIGHNQIKFDLLSLKLFGVFTINKCNFAPIKLLNLMALSKAPFMFSEKSEAKIKW